MRIVIELEGNNLTFPLDYNYIVQGFIYRNIDESLAKLLHDRGFVSRGRNFKLFTFSRLLGKYRIKNREIIFYQRVKFWIASPVQELIESFASNLLKKPEVTLNNELIYVTSVEVKAEKLFDKAQIFMLSPMTVYSTLLTADKRKKTYYYNPKEREFARLITENIRKKYRALYRKDPDELGMSIRPLRVNSSDEKIIRYKGFIIKGWMGRYHIEGDKELLSLAYDTGLGAKNSQGFGMFEIS